MFDELKKDLSSLKLLVTLSTLAVSIYLIKIFSSFLQDFSDIILILIFGWLVSFILDPFVDLLTHRLRLPKLLATAIIFVLAGLSIYFSFMIFVPELVRQLNALERIVPSFLRDSPVPLQRGIDNLVSSFSSYANIIPSITQFIINFVTILILSFYLVLERDNLNKRLYAIIPKKYHEAMRFTEQAINKSFASFLRIQVLWGVVGGFITWAVLTIFNVPFAASSSFMSGILTAVPMIGPIIGLIPPILVTAIEAPSKVLPVFLFIFIVQQIIFNILGPKIMGKAFNLNPVIIMLALLIGIKVAGFTGAVFAIPVVSIILVVGKEYYNFYVKEKES